MNKTIIININNIVFHIEEDAYDYLRAYMQDVKKHFSKTEGSEEIIEDIESRVSEIFSENLDPGRKEVINKKDVEEMVAQMGRVSDFSEIDEEEYSKDYENEEPAEDRTFSAARKLMRDPDDKILGGVSSGLALYFGIDAIWVRLGWLILFLLAGSGILIYIILWILVPIARTRSDKMAMRGKTPNLQNFKKSFEDELGGLQDNISNPNSGLRRGIQVFVDLVVRFFRLVGLFILAVFALAFGITIIALFIGLIVVFLSLIGVASGEFYPGFLGYLSSTESIIALISGFLAIVIPVFAIFYLFIRVLFKQKPMHNILTLSLLTIWIISLVGLLYYINLVKIDFAETSTIKIEEKIQPEEVFFFEQNDVKVFRIEKENKTKLNFIKSDINVMRRNYISIRFESLDSLSGPYIEYNYSAKGKTLQLASERASNIEYLAKQQGEKVSFDSHFSLNPQALERDQKVDAVVYLPVGTEVYLHTNLRDKIRNLSYKGCETEFSNKQNYTHWQMTNTGLDCLSLSDETDN
ncbi:MAG TPA: PspC domain-containing protein [Sphingobacterium sp.]|nr:PspC domain-containing protein [Sphingobacterium sp.]